MPEPIFNTIFDTPWSNLPSVFQRHYANRPNCNDLVIATGVMHIKMSKILFLAKPFLTLTKTLVPKTGVDVAVEVRFESTPGKNFFTFNRMFKFNDGACYKFKSTLEPIGDDRVIEWTDSGLGWHASYSYKDNHVHLQHHGYAIKLFGKVIKFPASYIFGASTAWERALDNDRFEMLMQINHPVFGWLYSYEGEFEITKDRDQ